MWMKFAGPRMVQEVSYLILEYFFELYSLVFTLLIPAEWQSLASWVQLDVCDPLVEEYICWSGYPEYNCLNTRTEITH